MVYPSAISRRPHRRSLDLYRLPPAGSLLCRALLLMDVALVLLVRFECHPFFVLAVGAALAVLGAIP